MMAVFRDLRGYIGEAWDAWNRFWFKPTDPATLSLIRLLAGGMLFYTHLVWSLDLEGFLGQQGWLPVDYIRSLTPPSYVDPSVNRWSVWSIFFLDRVDLVAVDRACVCAAGVLLLDDRAVQPHDGGARLLAGGLLRPAD